MRAKLNMHQKLLIALATAVTMLLLLAVAVWAYDEAQKDQIAPGITVGGVDIGGRDVDSARKVIKNDRAPILKAASRSSTTATGT